MYALDRNIGVREGNKSILLWTGDRAYVEWSHSEQSHILNQLG